MSARPRHRNENPACGARRRACAVLAAGCVAATACGGHTATKQDVIARANGSASTRCARCATWRRRREARCRPWRRTQGRSSRSSTRRHRILGACPDRLRLGDLLNRYVAAVSDSATSYRALAAAARAGDAPGVAQALSALRSNPAPVLATQYGLTECSAAAGTKAP